MQPETVRCKLHQEVNCAVSFQNNVSFHSFDYANRKYFYLESDNPDDLKNEVEQIQGIEFEGLRYQGKYFFCHGKEQK